MANTTWNPSDKTAAGTLSNGNLTFALGTDSGVRTISRKSTGKHYWEYTCTTWVSFNTFVGIANPRTVLSAAVSATDMVGLYSSGTIIRNGSSVGLTLGSRANGDIIGVALDADNKLIWFRVAPSGNWNGSGTADPATGVGGVSVVTLSPDSRLWPLYGYVGSQQGLSTVTANFGNSAFSGTVPSGFTAGLTDAVPLLLAADTQTALEQWLMPNADAQLTQLAAEEWGNVVSGARLALLTQIALEEWARVPSLARPMQTGVAINTG